jgi:hypothetical protein
MVDQCVQIEALNQQDVKLAPTSFNRLDLCLRICERDPNRISEKHEACQSFVLSSYAQIGAACLLQLQDLRAEWKSH